MFSGDGPITAKQGTDNAEGIAALRNAAPSMLALLEALLRNTGVVVGWHEVEAALAAFVEGE